LRGSEVLDSDTAGRSPRERADDILDPCVNSDRFSYSASSGTHRVFDTVFWYQTFRFDDRNSETFFTFVIFAESVGSYGFISRADRSLSEY
jgi:hypothetical protein